MQDVIGKFKFKDKGVIINAPADIETEFTKLGFKLFFAENIKSTNTLIFVYNRNELLDFLGSKLKNTESDSVLWIAYPKGTSKIKTDINRDIIRGAAEDFNITTVTAISINETWSALRFRPIDKVGR